MTLGERLRSLRERKNLSQTELAKWMNLPNQSISNYERDYRKPPFEVIQKLADFYEVSIDYLLGREQYVTGTEKVKDIKSFLKEGIFFYGNIPLDEQDLQFLRSCLDYIVHKKIKGNPTN